MKKDFTPGQQDLFGVPGPRALVPMADVCTSRHRGAEASVDAFNATPEVARKRQRISCLNFVKAKGVHGATSEETSFLLGIPYTAASARFSELKRLGMIVPTGDRRATSHGRTAEVFVAAALEGGKQD